MSILTSAPPFITGKIVQCNYPYKIKSKLFIFSFAKIDKETWKVEPSDAWQDLKDFGGKGGFSKIVAMKRQNKNLEVILGIGGWGAGSVVYSNMAKDEKKREIFVKSAVEIVKKHKFDGFDLDWEYPGKKI